VRKPVDLAAALAAVEELPTQPLTLAELVQAHALVTLDGSDTRLRKWTAAFGHRSAWGITSEELETAAQALVRHGYKPSAVNRDLSALGSAYRWAKAKRLSPRGFRSPTLGVVRFEEAIRRVEVTQEQIDALKARSLGFADRRFGVFVALLVDTGARKSELLERTWKDFDLDRGQILCETTKTGVPRVLHFRPETAELVRRVFPRRPDAALPFEGRVPGQPICFRKAWLTAVTEIGLPGLHMHDIRHAAAAGLLRSGATLGVAAQVLGHSPQVLARRYGHLETAALDRRWTLGRCGIGEPHDPSFCSNCRDSSHSETAWLSARLTCGPRRAWSMSIRTGRFEASTTSEGCQRQGAVAVRRLRTSDPQASRRCAHRGSIGATALARMVQKSVSWIP
jgi:integrase